MFGKLKLVPIQESRKVELSEAELELKTIQALLRCSVRDAHLDYAIRLKYGELIETHETYVIARFYGGMNGGGHLRDYLYWLRVLVTEIERHFTDVWLIKMDNDCLDDVFLIDLGIRLEKKLKQINV